MISRVEQVAELRQGVTDLIATLEAGGIAQMEPHERLDLWQYLQAVRVRLALAERALAGDGFVGDQSGSEPEHDRHLTADSGQAGPGPAAFLGPAGSTSPAGAGPRGST